MKTLIIFSIVTGLLLTHPLLHQRSPVMAAEQSSLSLDPKSLTDQDKTPEDEKLREVPPGADPAFDEAEPPLEEDEPEILPPDLAPQFQTFDRG